MPATEDPVPIAVAGLPRAGVIDPSLVIAGGRPHLAYKTDRIPSSIRLLPLSRSGQHAAGADVTSMPHSRRMRVFFHAWTCHGTTTPCGPGIGDDKVRHRARAVRPMYAADLDWIDGVPVIARFV